MNQAMKNKEGYRCKIKGCPKAKNRRFSSLEGLRMHLMSIHGICLSQKEYKTVAKYGKYVKQDKRAYDLELKKRIDYIKNSTKFHAI